MSLFSNLHVYELGLKGCGTFGFKVILPWKDIHRIHTYRTHISSMNTPGHMVHDVIFEGKHSKKEISIKHAVFIEEDLQVILRENIPNILHKLNGGS